MDKVIAQLLILGLDVLPDVPAQQVVLGWDVWPLCCGADRVPDAL